MAILHFPLKYAKTAGCANKATAMNFKDCCLNWLVAWHCRLFYTDTFSLHFHVRSGVCQVSRDGNFPGIPGFSGRFPQFPGKEGAGIPGFPGKSRENWHFQDSRFPGIHRSGKIDTTK